MATTPFREAVFAATRRIPAGHVSTYQSIAQAIGRPKAVRAVGNALNSNTNTQLVPCHRVVRSDGSIGGYQSGTPAKLKKLTAEGIHIKNNKVIDFESKYINL